MTDPIHGVGDIVAERYEVRELIGEGGMQQVFKAVDKRLGKTVALKTPKGQSAEKRFERSARLCARIVHPNVAKTLDYFEDGGRFYLVEELIGGVDLGKMLDEEYELLDPHLACRVLHHMAKGVAASHHAEVFHRDIKPSNVMVSNGDFSEVKITDFGVAKLTESEFEALKEGEESITGSQTVVGALPYMAPELIEVQPDAGLPADIWSLGAMAYRLIAGDYPFGAGLQAVPRILEAAVPAQPRYYGRRQQFGALEEELWQIIVRCLSRVPAQRPTADDLVEWCGKLCYSVAPRRRGKVMQYRAGTGRWGFVSGKGADVFFHEDSFYGGRPRVGQRVSYAAFAGVPRARAHPVLPLKQS